ncbi:hypothetical protein K505DRAFT_93129 [Melanomma pulvis-pyrius CBS 109.77]|uniref:Uncharacterized protein n=1 Tax=Melanomma pulvis-pyrius CBS 109.77 TaxID=1314802 RepID=A0A6A6WZX0_9PLEO|nr:hypothetical protein K505DRAFT_93129 [Melanomma pulvis-pyrius CBS 109.77]
MSGPNGDTGTARQEPDFAQAFKDLARGEQTADAMEKHLDAVEKKIEELLAKADEEEQNLKSKSKPSAEPLPSNEAKDKA